MTNLLLFKVWLGNYPYMRFAEEEVQFYIEEFEAQLKDISRHIEERNKSLDMPYTYMDPKKIPNSITI